MMHEIDGPAGRLEARLDQAVETPRAVAVIASPHPQDGGTMQDKVVYHAAQGLLRVGCAVLRFNYRGSGTSAGTFSGGPGELDDYRAALDAAAQRYPAMPIWAVGYSFGAYVAMVTGATDSRVSQLVGIGALVDHYDFSPLHRSDTSKILVHGERDELCSLKTIRRFYGELPEPRELVVIDMADHYFDGHASEVADALEDLLGDA
jgi:alpha/beta superfamily hydrolase